MMNSVNSSAEMAATMRVPSPRRRSSPMMISSAGSPYPTAWTVASGSRR